MTIQAVTEKDIENCAKVFVQTYNEAPWNYHWEFKDALKYLAEYYSSPQFKGFLLYDNDVFAGAMFAHTKTWWTGVQLHIDELFIAPDSQKKGYGRTLMRYAEQYALENGLGTITLMTHKFMPSMKFYEGIDFMHAQPLVVLFKPLL
jgi:aminoglycoside 6'-N-acetyltransferase I